MKVNIKKMVKSWNLSEKDIRDLVLHVGDHAGAQGHTRAKKLDYLESCPDCIKLMKRLFPDNNW